MKDKSTVCALEELRSQEADGPTLRAVYGTRAGQEGATYGSEVQCEAF